MRVHLDSRIDVDVQHSDDQSNFQRDRVSRGGIGKGGHSTLCRVAQSAKEATTTSCGLRTATPRVFLA